MTEPTTNTQAQKEPLVLILSQMFLPGGGGLERFIDFVATELRSRKISEVEVVCLSRGDRTKEAEFEANYPLKVFRVKSRLYTLAQRSSQRFNTIVGGDQRLNIFGKAAMFLFAITVVSGMFRVAIKRSWENRKRKIIFHCMSISSLIIAVGIKKLLFFRNTKIIFSNQFTYKKSGFGLADHTISYLLQQADKVVNVSRYSAEQLAESFNLDKNKLAVCYSWQPLPKLNKALHNKLSKRGKGKIKVLFIGRIVPEKGIENIINLARYINRQGLNDKYSITVAGDSNHPIRSKLMEATKKYKVLNYVGRIERVDIWDYYASHDLFLFPAQSDGEGCNRIIIEAYSMGMPVISTNFGAIVEMLSLFPKSKILDKQCSDSEMLSAVDDLYVFSRQRKNETFLNECRKIVDSAFSNKNFEIYRSVYNELLRS